MIGSLLHANAGRRLRDYGAPVALLAYAIGVASWAHAFDYRPTMRQCYLWESDTTTDDCQSRDLTTAGTPALDAQTIQGANAVEFDSGGDTLAYGAGFYTPGTDADTTWGCWAKPSTLTADEAEDRSVIMGVITGASSAPLAFGTEPVTLGVQDRWSAVTDEDDCSTRITAEGPTVTLDEWRHVVVRHDSLGTGSLTLYVSDPLTGGHTRVREVRPPNDQCGHGHQSRMATAWNGPQLAFLGHLDECWVYDGLLGGRAICEICQHGLDGTESRNCGCTDEGTTAQVGGAAGTGIATAGTASAIRRDQP